MTQLFQRLSKSQYSVLNDLNGNPYKFYRGKEYNLSQGCFFCSCFDIAHDFRLSTTEPILEAEIVVRNPLVIDATINGGYSYYERLCIRDCPLYPESLRDDLVRYLSVVGARNTLSTDEILAWARKARNIDAVIIKNVREGINSNFPIYDVAIWNEANLRNVRNVAYNISAYNSYRENTPKRVDLSCYLQEDEYDGVVSTIRKDGFRIEHAMHNGTNGWSLTPVMLIDTEKPVYVFELSTRRFVTAKLLRPGVYHYTLGSTQKQPFIPYNGNVQITGIISDFDYRVVKTNYLDYDFHSS